MNYLEMVHVLGYVVLVKQSSVIMMRPRPEYTELVIAGIQEPVSVRHMYDDLRPYFPNILSVLPATDVSVGG